MFIKVYLADTTPLICDEDKFNKIYETLPKYRQEKIDRYKFQKDKCLSLGVGYLLKRAVSDLGYPKIDEDISVGQHGKPYFSEHSDIYFNLSHSENMAMCVISDCEVGCDIQFIENLSDYPIKKMLSQSDYDEITKSKDKNIQRDNFFKLWAIKESFLKLLGIGFSGASANISVSLDGTIKQDISKDSFSVFEICTADNYKCFCTVKNYKGIAPQVININF